MAFRAGSRSQLWHCGLAPILAGVAALASVGLAPHWNPRYFPLPFYPPVMLSAWLGGFGPGVVTTFLCALAISYPHLPSTRWLTIRDPGDLIGFLLFLCVGVLISLLNARLLAAERRKSIARDLQREIDERRTVEAIAAKLATVADELQTSVERYRQQIGSLAGLFRVRRDLFLDPGEWQELAASLTPGVMVTNRELRWRRRDGAPLTVLATIRETDGFVEGIAIDITDRTNVASSSASPMPSRKTGDPS